MQESWQNGDDYQDNIYEREEETEDWIIPNNEWQDNFNYTDSSYVDYPADTVNSSPRDRNALSASSSTLGTGELRPGELMNAKIPPAFNGRSSWFAYEEQVFDWTDITILQPGAQLLRPVW